MSLAELVSVSMSVTVSTTVSVAVYVSMTEFVSVRDSARFRCCFQVSVSTWQILLFLICFDTDHLVERVR